MPDEKPKPRKPKGAASVQKPMRPGPLGGALQTGHKERPAPKTIPNAPKPGRPGHNKGGWLKSGNTVGVGRKPADIRTEILTTVGDATAVMRSILDGEYRIEIRDMFGKIVGYRTATIKEFTAVWEALAKHALPTKTEVSGPDGGAIPVQQTTAELSGLSVEEREALLTMLEKAEAARAE